MHCVSGSQDVQAISISNFNRLTLPLWRLTHLATLSAHFTQAYWAPPSSLIIIYGKAFEGKTFMIHSPNWFRKKRINQLWLDLQKPFQIAQEWNPIYSLAWKLDSSTTQTHHSQGYRWPGLLLQAVFCRPCKTMTVHYRVYGATEGH